MALHRAIWKPGPTFYADRRVIEDVTRENHHYEGGIYVDGGLARVDSVTDLSPLVRGWGGLGLIAQSPKAAPAGGSSTAPPMRTSPLSMTGLHTMRTRSLSVTGLRAFHVTSMTLVGLRTLRASPVSMSGVRVIETTRLQITGVRQLRTQTIMMTGYRLPP